MRTGIAAVLAVVTIIPVSGQKAERPRVYIEAAETVDASNSKDKAKQVDFGAALAAAIQKKEVPVTVVTDKSKSTWTIHSISAQREDRYRHKSHQDSGSRGVRWQLYTVLRHDSGHRQ